MHAAGQVGGVEAGLGQKRGSPSRAATDAAGDHYSAVTGKVFDPLGQLAERYVDGVRYMPGFPLVVLPYVEEQSTLADEVVCFFGPNLAAAVLSHSSDRSRQPRPKSVTVTLLRTGLRLAGTAPTQAVL